MKSIRRKKAAICLLFSVLFVFSCCGCKNTADTNTDTVSSKKSIVVHMPDEDDHSIHGYRLPTVSGTESSESQKAADDSQKYCANTENKIYHFTSCPNAGEIPEENIYYSNSAADMESRGYSACQICKPK